MSTTRTIEARFRAALVKIVETGPCAGDDLRDIAYLALTGKEKHYPGAEQVPEEFRK